jgi:hypothetical protein
MTGSSSGPSDTNFGTNVDPLESPPGERCLHTAEVAGSIPASPTLKSGYFAGGIRSTRSTPRHILVDKEGRHRIRDAREIIGEIEEAYARRLGDGRLETLRTILNDLSPR